MVKIKYVERLKGGDNFVRLFIEIGKKIMFKLGIKIVIIEVDNVKKIKECYLFQNYQLLEFQDYFLFYSICSNCLFFFKDLNVSGRRIFFNDFGYYIVFGIKVLGVLIFGKNKVRFEKKNLLLFNVGLLFFLYRKKYCQVFCQFVLFVIDLLIKCNKFYNDKI